MFKQLHKIESNYINDPDALTNSPMFAIVSYELTKADKSLQRLQEQLRDRRLAKLDVTSM